MDCLANSDFLSPGERHFLAKMAQWTNTLTGPVSVTRVQSGLHHLDSDGACRFLDACKFFKEQNRFPSNPRQKVVNIFIQPLLNWTFGTFFLSAPSRCYLPHLIREMHMQYCSMCVLIVFHLVPDYLSAFELINKPVLEKKSVDVPQLKLSACPINNHHYMDAWLQK